MISKKSNSTESNLKSDNPNKASLKNHIPTDTSPQSDSLIETSPRSVNSKNTDTYQYLSNIDTSSYTFINNIIQLQDGRIAVSASTSSDSYSTSILIYTIPEGRLVYNFTDPAVQNIYGVMQLQDRRLIASVYYYSSSTYSHYNSIQTWNVSTGNLLGRYIIVMYPA